MTEPHPPATARRRVTWEGAPLALITLFGLLAFAALTIGAMAGSQACLGALVTVAGVAALAVRAPVGAWAGASAARVVGQRGLTIARPTRIAVTVWGLLALDGGAAALSSSCSPPSRRDSHRDAVGECPLTRR